MREPGFWRNLAPLPLGFQLVQQLTDLDFEIHLLTKGPADHSLGWMEKVDWCRHYLPHLPVTISEAKSLVYGSVLVDDWPPFIERWLHHFPSGFVVASAQPWNLDVETRFGPRVMRFDGSNVDVVRRGLLAAKASHSDA